MTQGRKHGVAYPPPKTNWLVEGVAGLSTYLSLSYIFVVNPAILGSTGFSREAVLLATVIASGLATLAMGIWADLPFAVAPGLEMNSFFAYAVVLTGILSVRDAFAAVFWSGVLIIICSTRKVLDKIVRAIPDSLKVSISFSVGVFVLMTGLKLARIVPFANGTPQLQGWTWTALLSHPAILLYAGLFLSIVFSLPKWLGLSEVAFPGGLLVAIIVCAFLAYPLGISAPHTSGLSAKMFSGILGFQLFPTRFTFQFVTVTFVFLIVNFIGGIGKFIGLTANVRELNLNGEVKNIGRASIVDGAGTVVGAMLGTSSLITYVESSVGIASGGVRGLTAIVCGTLMLLSLVVAPYVGLIPVEATAGVLVYAGMTLFPIKQARSSSGEFSRFDMTAALIMGALSAVFFGLDKAMLAGFLLYSGRNLLRKDGQPRNWYLLSTTLLLFTSVLLGWIQGR